MHNSFSEVITVTEVEANHSADIIGCHRRGFTRGDQAHRVSKRTYPLMRKIPSLPTLQLRGKHTTIRNGHSVKY